MKGVGKRKDSIELEEVNINEHVYEDLNKKHVNINAYENVQSQRKTKLTNMKQLKMDKLKVVVSLLCVGIAVLVAADVTVVCLVLFGVTDGGWTNWENLGACSATCGTGYTTRIRTCSNPRPSIMGRSCDGRSVLSCNNTSCSAISVTNGGWANWENWEACSVTCGTGFTTRIRTCSNPRPSSVGQYCDGTSVQVLQCNNTTCSGESIGFSVHWPNTSSGGNPLTFKKALYNDNDVDNINSGEFVCQKEGLYLFISTLMTVNYTMSSVHCYFYKNNGAVNYYGSLAYSKNVGDKPSSTSSILYHLKPGDRVYLGSCNGMEFMASGSGFTGFLINSIN